MHTAHRYTQHTRAHTDGFYKVVNSGGWEGRPPPSVPLGTPASGSGFPGLLTPLIDMASFPEFSAVSSCSQLSTSLVPDKKNPSHLIFLEDLYTFHILICPYPLTESCALPSSTKPVMTSRVSCSCQPAFLTVGQTGFLLTEPPSNVYFLLNVTC